MSLSVGDIAPVAYLRINEAYLEKTNEDRVSLPPQIPPLLDGKWEEVENSAGGNNIGNMLTHTPPPSPSYASQGVAPIIVATKRGRRGVWYSISNVFVPHIHSPSIETECKECWEEVRRECGNDVNSGAPNPFSQEKLDEFHLDLMNVSHVNVYLSSMAYFPTINAVMYGIFGSSPPTRACVSVDLQAPQRVCLDIMAFSDTDRRARHSLHVQSVSYWAPANIGPYSQSITVSVSPTALSDNSETFCVEIKIDRQWMFVSGQIGLIPRNMTMPDPPSVAREIALALQHADRVSSATMDGLAISAHSKIIHSAIVWMVDVGAVLRVNCAWAAAGKVLQRPVVV